MTARIEYLSNVDYHGRVEAVSNSMLECYRVDGPAVYHARYVSRTLSGESADHFRIGNAVHAKIAGEEPPSIVPEEALTRDGKKFGKKWAEWRAEHSGEDYLTPAEARETDAMVESILANPTAARLLNLAKHREQSIFWDDEDSQLARKCRPDALVPGLIIDLKTTRIRYPTPKKFGRIGYEWGYHRQGAFYQDGVKQIMGEEWQPVYIVVSKLPPYCTLVSGWDENALDLGRSQVHLSLTRLARHYSAGDWSDELGTTISTLELPHWAWKED